MKRTVLLVAALAVSALMPLQTLQAQTLQAQTVSDNTFSNVAQDVGQDAGQIARWNAYLETHPQTFSWQAHNELRHLYADTDAAKSMQQVNIILAHSFMDPYMLNVLSDWQSGKDGDLVAVALLDKANRYASLPFLRVASLLQAVEIRRAQGRFAEARTLAQSAETFARQARRNLQKADRVRLKNYQKLARLQLDALRLYQKPL